MPNMTIEAGSLAGKLLLASYAAEITLPSMGQPYAVGLTQAHWKGAIDGRTFAYDTIGIGYDRGLGLLNATASTYYEKFTVDGVGSIAVGTFSLPGPSIASMAKGTISSHFEDAMGYARTGTPQLSASDDIIDGTVPGRNISFDFLHSEALVAHAGKNALVQSARGTDIVLGTEKLHFLNGDLYLGADGVGAQVNRIYQAVLDRDGDPVGLSSWTTSVESHKLDMRQVVDGFVGSQEFAERFGALDSPGFIEKLYHNILGREPDAEGTEYWAKDIASGASLANMVLSFTESVENKSAYEASHTKGTMVLNGSTIANAQVFHAMHGRMPDLAEIRAMKTVVDNGGSAYTLLVDALTSGGSKELYGSMSNQAFVQTIYSNAVGHAASNDYSQALAAKLDRGQASHESVAWEISQSHDAMVHISTLIHQDAIFA